MSSSIAVVILSIGLAASIDIYHPPSAPAMISHPPALKVSPIQGTEGKLKFSKRSQSASTLSELDSTSLGSLNKKKHKNKLDVEEVCVDQMKECATWAALNECNKNMQWMLPNCAMSCGQ